MNTGKAITGEYTYDLVMYEETTNQYNYYIGSTFLGRITWLKNIDSYGFVPVKSWSYYPGFLQQLINELNNLTNEKLGEYHGYQERLPGEEIEV